MSFANAINLDQTKFSSIGIKLKNISEAFKSIVTASNVTILTLAFDKISALSKLKAFADYNVNVAHVVVQYCLQNCLNYYIY